MAVIVLQGADFSSNNIGTISLKKTISPTTKAILNRYGIVADVENELHYAVETFVNHLTKAKLLGDGGKIKSLCMPFLSSELDKSSINALDGSNFFMASVKSSLTLEKGGLKAIPSANTSKVNLTGLYPSLPEGGVHFSGYNVTNDKQSGNPEVPATWLYGQCGLFLGLQKYHPSGPCIMTDAGGRIYGDINYKEVPCLLIANIRKDYASLFANGQKTDSSSPSWYSAEAWENPPFATYRQDTYKDEGPNCTISSAAWGLLSIGDMLNDEESALYNNEVNKLMAIVAKKFA